MIKVFATHRNGITITAKFGEMWQAVLCAAEMVERMPPGTEIQIEEN